MSDTENDNGMIAAALRAEDARYAAQIVGDLDALDALFADDLDYIHSSTVRDTKASFIESLRSGKVVYRSMTRGETNVRVFGNVAIITGDAVFEVTAAGEGQDVESTVPFRLDQTRARVAVRLLAGNAAAGLSIDSDCAASPGNICASSDAGRGTEASWRSARRAENSGQTRRSDRSCLRR